MTLTIRPAQESDKHIIRRMVRQAGLNPLSLDWQRFVVAQFDGAVIGVGQVKPHRDGSRELASLVVEEAFRGQGVGGAIVHDLLSRESGPVYLFCRDKLEGYYQRFGFTAAGRSDLPPVMSRLILLPNLFTRVASLFNLRTVRIIAMKRSLID